MTTDDAGSAQEADADSTRLSSPATEPAPPASPPASAPPGAHRRQRRQAARSAWRRWRRSPAVLGRPAAGAVRPGAAGAAADRRARQGPDQAGDLHRHRRRVRRADRHPADRGGHRALGQPDPPGVLRHCRDRARHHLVPRLQPRRVRPRHAARDHRRGARLRLGSGRARLGRRQARRTGPRRRPRGPSRRGCSREPGRRRRRTVRRSRPHLRDARGEFADARRVGGHGHDRGGGRRDLRRRRPACR